jgi:group I intron endonuclease
MFYCIYKITNKIDGKIYIGSHKTEKLDDSYMGSGKYLKYAQEKYGIENFTKEILFVFDTAEQMYAKEAELVNEEFIATENTYNLKVGGFGGWDFINKNLTAYDKSERARHAGSFGSGFLGKTHTEKHRRTLSNVHKGNSYFGGRKHSAETKKVMSKSAKERLTDPTKNSQYGTMWITNEKDNMKIPKDGIIPTGWRKGRKIKCNI